MENHRILLVMFFCTWEIFDVRGKSLTQVPGLLFVFINHFYIDVSVLKSSLCRWTFLSFTSISARMVDR